MAHFGGDTTISRETPKDWLVAGAQIGHIINDWSGRTDLVAYVSETAGHDHGAPALFLPFSAEIEVNTKVAFGNAKPRDIGDLRERVNQFEFPKAAGAIFHEAMHARFSTWDMPSAFEALTRNEYDALHLLEESRVEGLGVRIRPENRAFLRSCALDIVLGDAAEQIGKMSDTRQAAYLAALTYARVTADVLVRDDILLIAEAVDKIIAEPLMDKLRAIWTEFQSIQDTVYGIERMYDLARLWNRTVQDAAEEAGEGAEEQQTPGDKGEQGEQGAAGEGGPSEAMKALMEALAEDAEATSVSADSELTDQQTTEKWKEEAAANQKDYAERADHKDESTKVFGKGSGPDKFETNSRLVGTRNPTAPERVAAVTVARQLEKAKYRDRVSTSGTSQIPPGRLRTRALVQANAQRANGVVPTVEPWRRTMRKHTDDPNLTIGVMVDISGSMGSAMEPMASAAWILSEAVRRVQGKLAMVYYGNDVFPTLKPGEHLEQVKTYTAQDGTERFNKGFKALDGALTLLHGEGARMLVIVSDGAYTSTEKPLAKKWLQRCQAAGVGVLWLGFGTYAEEYAGKLCKGTDAVFVPHQTDVAGAALAIGKAAEKALTAAGSRRNGR